MLEKTIALAEAYDDQPRSGALGVGLIGLSHLAKSDVASPLVAMLPLIREHGERHADAPLLAWCAQAEADLAEAGYLPDDAAEAELAAELSPAEEESARRLGL